MKRMSAARAIPSRMPIAPMAAYRSTPYAHSAPRLSPLPLGEKSWNRPVIACSTMYPETSVTQAPSAQDRRTAPHPISARKSGTPCFRGTSLVATAPATNIATAAVAADFPQFAALANATPYQRRHTFVSCCLQAGVSLATIAAWCGTSIQTISGTYGRVIRRLEGEAPVELFLQYRTAKVQAMTLLSGTPRRSKTEPQGGSTGAVLARSWTLGGSTGGSTVVKMPRKSSRKRAD
jgi:hypothetical protein